MINPHWEMDNLINEFEILFKYVQDHFFAFLGPTLLFLISTFSMTLELSPSVSFFMVYTLSVWKVYRYFPFLILNLVTLPFFLMNKAELEHEILFLGAFGALASFLVFSGLVNFAKSATVLTSFGWIRSHLPFGDE